MSVLVKVGDPLLRNPEKIGPTSSLEIRRQSAHLITEEEALKFKATARKGRARVLRHPYTEHPERSKGERKIKPPCTR